MEWTRPDTIPFPKVWHTFEGLREIDGVKLKFWIQDVPEDISKDVIDSLRSGYVNDEPMCKFFKLGEDLDYVAEASEVYNYIIRNKLSCVCMTNDLEGKAKIVGISTLIRKSVDDPPYCSHIKTYAQLINIANYVYSTKDIFKHLNITEYLCDKGIYVFPEYRKQGICYQFLKCWSIIGKAVGLSVAAGTFTSVFSQGVAKRAGFYELTSIEYAELAKIKPEFCLPGIEEHTEAFKIMYTTF